MMLERQGELASCHMLSYTYCMWKRKESGGSFWLVGSVSVAVVAGRPQEQQQCGIGPQLEWRSHCQVGRCSDELAQLLLSLDKLRVEELWHIY